jgi:hypothetical protein
MTGQSWPPAIAEAIGRTVEPGRASSIEGSIAMRMLSSFQRPPCLCRLGGLPVRRHVLAPNRFGTNPANQYSARRAERSTGSAARTSQACALPQAGIRLPIGAARGAA